MQWPEAQAPLERLRPLVQTVVFFMELCYTLSAEGMERVNPKGFCRQTGLTVEPEKHRRRKAAVKFLCHSSDKMREIV